MKGRYRLSVITLTLAFLLWAYNWVLPDFHPTPPSVYILVACIAAIAVINGPTRLIRILGGILVIVALCISVEQASLLNRVHQRVEADANFLSSIFSLNDKLKKYDKLHPLENLTNLSDYVKLGVIHPADTNFLSGAKVILFPRNEVGEHRFMELWRTNAHMVIGQDRSVQ